MKSLGSDRRPNRLTAYSLLPIALQRPQRPLDGLCRMDLRRVVQGDRSILPADQHADLRTSQDDPFSPMLLSTSTMRMNSCFDDSLTFPRHSS